MGVPSHTDLGFCRYIDALTLSPGLCSLGSHYETGVRDSPSVPIQTSHPRRVTFERGSTFNHHHANVLGADTCFLAWSRRFTRFRHLHFPHQPDNIQYLSAATKSRVTFKGLAIRRGRLGHVSLPFDDAKRFRGTTTNFLLALLASSDWP